VLAPTPLSNNQKHAFWKILLESPFSLLVQRSNGHRRRLRLLKVGDAMTGAIANPQCRSFACPYCARRFNQNALLCFDALSAKLVEQAGFDLTFYRASVASASRLGT